MRFVVKIRNLRWLNHLTKITIPRTSCKQMVYSPTLEKPSVEGDFAEREAACSESARSGNESPMVDVDLSGVWNDCIMAKWLQTLEHLRAEQIPSSHSTASQSWIIHYASFPLLSAFSKRTFGLNWLGERKTSRERERERSCSQSKVDVLLVIKLQGQSVVID